MITHRIWTAGKKNDKEHLMSIKKIIWNPELITELPNCQHISEKWPQIAEKSQTRSTVSLRVNTSFRAKRGFTKFENSFLPLWWGYNSEFQVFTIQSANSNSRIKLNKFSKKNWNFTSNVSLPSKLSQKWVVCNKSLLNKKWSNLLLEIQMYIVFMKSNHTTFKIFLTELEADLGTSSSKVEKCNYLIIHMYTCTPAHHQTKASAEAACVIF